MKSVAQNLYTELLKQLKIAAKKQGVSVDEMKSRYEKATFELMEDGAWRFTKFHELTMYSRSKSMFAISLWYNKPISNKDLLQNIEFHLKN